MAETPRPAAAQEVAHWNADALATGTQALAELQRQTHETGELLTRLRQDVLDAEHHLGSSQAVQLLEANEQLVLATLRAQVDTDTAVMALKEASRTAELDTLTELPNRIFLLDRFAQAIAVARRHSGRLALLFLDLNNFKQINDTLGHGVGDEVLQRVAQRLLSSVREADTVSRHGGDEFLILLTEVSQATDAVRIAEKVIAALGAPMTMRGQALLLSSSVGISIFPDDGDTAITLIHKADIAMYRAKKRGPGSFIFHDSIGAEDLGAILATQASPPLPTPAQPAQADYELRHAQLCEANEQLVLAALNAQDLQATAERAQRRQTEFLAVLAHELRNPLMPITNATALLGRIRSDEPLLRQLRAVIERQVAHMSRLVGDLLDVSRFNTGKLRLQREALDMGKLIDEVADIWRPVMHKRTQRLDVKRPAGPLSVFGDSLRLTQVLSNLLDNASKYTPDGGLITLVAEVALESLAMTITDSGIGIAAEALPYVFDPFVQDTRAIGFNGVGLGIGLTVVRELVEAHGGWVEASSAGTGLGSRFVVTLPMAAPDSSQASKSR